MKKKEMQGIVNDLVELRSWRNPLKRISVKGKATLNLLTRNVSGPIHEKDSLGKLLKEKLEWFKERMIKEGIDTSFISEAKIIINRCTENAKIIYKGKEFKASKAW